MEEEEEHDRTSLTYLHSQLAILEGSQPELVGHVAAIDGSYVHLRSNIKGQGP